MDQKMRARLSSARAREALLRVRRIASKSRERDIHIRGREKELLRDRSTWSRSRERDFHMRERESRFPEDVIDAFSSEKSYLSMHRSGLFPREVTSSTSWPTNHYQNHHHSPPL
ncbi:hypothetical protein JCGZ_24252 [Jatropha curcas]|uniref:Uncharacterized protein n=1 Tax=Jatropha curcas TaxID=180498 RepID=A0A067K1L3_JATCU|nr:hypothetical protein JCGZ_24252 [Jatropha curcas]